MWRSFSGGPAFLPYVQINPFIFNYIPAFNA
jgi:hypothetical protein